MQDAVNKLQTGLMKEQSAMQYLQTQGLTYVTKNYRCPFGEIDLIMLDQDEIVFIEVRFRSSSHYGSAIESVDEFKQRKLLKSATHFLQKKNLLDTTPCRFDIVGFSKDNIDWIKDAFSYE
jgi:putative endonuclease